MRPEEQLIQERIRKLKEIKALGINPYPYKFDKRHNALELQNKFKKLKKHEKTRNKVSVAGRIMLLRRMGKVTFMQIQDQTGQIQLYFAQDKIGKDKYKFLKKLDLGDFIGTGGIIFKTKTGEVTVDVKKYELLTKSLRPLPDKWHGLKDPELRYRQRYVDLTVNPEVKDVFIKRTQIIDSIRETLNKKNFLEVDTPCIQPIYGGANARPFKTHLNALNMDVYLRISNELYLKRLIVGGFEYVYEFARDFRNEGIDKTHNPEFTQVEIYQAYTDYNDMMKLVEDIFVDACKKVNNGKTKVKFGKYEINFKKPWKKLTLIESIKEYANIDVNKLSDSKLREIVREFNPDEASKLSRGMLIAAIFEEKVEQHLIQPIFIINHPIETTPLCKPLRKGDQNFVERFEPFVAGMEVANAYSELNDPILQRKLLEEQAEQLKAGSEEAHPMDEDFIHAIEFGMPPTGGVGIGVDRMIMLLTNSESIRDVILFPFMRPEEISSVKKQVKEYKKLSCPISRKEALKLVKKYNKDKNDFYHFLESEAIMKALAKKLGEDEEVWAMLGLLHDIDWGLVEENTKEHCIKAVEILKKAGFSDDFIEIIQSHAYGEGWEKGKFYGAEELRNKKRTAKVEHALAAAETITGLIHAYALMRGGFEGMKAKGLKKKFNDKSFAAAINRDIIKECEKIGLELSEFLQLSIDAMKGIAKDIGF